MRTLPDRSEFRRSSRDAELCEDGAHCAGIFRVRFGSERGNPQGGQQRKLSTASSPSSFKTWAADEEDEVDPFGYVLAGSPLTPERGISSKIHETECFIVFTIKYSLLMYLIFYSVCRGLQRSSRLKNNLSPMVLKDPQEYEIMRQESGACSDIDNASIISHDASPLPSPSTSAPLPAYSIEIVGSDVTNTEDKDGQKDSTHQLTNPSGNETKAVDEQGEGAQVKCRYEYMDISRSNSTEEDNPAKKSDAACAGGTMEADHAMAVLTEEHKEAVKEDKCPNTDKEHPLQVNVSSVSVDEPDVPQVGDENGDEYEEMTIQRVVPIGWEQADYQNLPVKGRTCPEDAGSGRCGGIGEYIKVCAGMGEPGGNTSFDNPDYWHSRLFLQPDAVRT